MNYHRPKFSLLQNELREAVKRHLPQVESWENRFTQHLRRKLPHVSVLAKMATYDRDTMIAYQRFKMLEAIANVRSGCVNRHGHAAESMKSWKAGLSRLEKVHQAFAEVALESRGA